jgi:asparagine synthase (glutamine-hydrolysing)
MPNLVGLWNPKLSKSEIALCVEQQLRRVRVPGIKYSDYLNVQDGFGIGFQDHGIHCNGEQPARMNDGDLSLMLDGELYNIAELLVRFRDHLPNRTMGQPEICLHLIAKFGVEIVNEFNGCFCIGVYFKKENRLFLISDRLGVRPLFYVKRGASLIFATELKALAVVDPQSTNLDEVGLFEFFSYGSHILEKTSIEGYTKLVPASILKIDDEGMQIARYWTYQYDEKAPSLDQPTYYCQYVKLLDRAVERCMITPKKIGIFLSGGYDSRAIAASIRKYHLPIPAFTFGETDSRDMRFARMLADRLGLEHHAVSSNEPFLYPTCRSVVWRTEGLLSFAHCTSIHNHELIKEKMDIILVGLLGEFGGSHTWPKLLLARDRKDVIETLFGRMTLSRSQQIQRIFRRSFLNRVADPARVRFEQSFESIPNDHPLNIADCWQMTALKPRLSNQSPSVDRHRFETRVPHMDAELVEFLLTIPPYARIEHRVYKKMIAYGFPEIRDVPCTNSGLSINPHFYQEYPAMVYRYLSGKAATRFRQLLNIKEPLGRNEIDRGDKFLAEPEIIEYILNPLLNNGIFPSDIFNINAIELIISEHYSRQQDHSELLSQLISWGEASKYFVHKDLTDVPDSIFLNN